MMPVEPPADSDPDVEDEDDEGSLLEAERAQPADGEADTGDEPLSDEHLSALARWVGSDQGIVWLKRIALAAALAFLVGSVGYLIGVRTLDRPGSVNAVDAGFLRDMTDHHDQAVSMAQLALYRGSDELVRKFALEVIMFQRWELGRMQAFKDDLGVEDPEYSLDRETMEWMGMSTPLRSMPGMASEEQLKQLDAARGVEADKLFLTLMQAHHLGGAHMADYEAEHGANPKLRALAGRMASNQRVEVREYQSHLRQLESRK